MMATSAACRPTPETSRQQHGGGDRAGSGDQRDGERKSGDVVDHVLGHGDVGDLLLAVLRRSNTISKAIQNSRNPPATRKAGKVMPNTAKIVRPAEREQRQHGKPDQRGADRHLPPLVAVHAARDGEEKRCQPGGSIVTRTVTNALNTVSLLGIIALVPRKPKAIG